MPQLIVTTRKGETQTIEAKENMSVMVAIRDAGVSEMLALCGGVCSCATCHIHVDPEFASLLPPMSEDEDALLDGSNDRDEHSRLGCQILFNDSMSGLRVRMAEEN